MKSKKLLVVSLMLFSLVSCRPDISYSSSSSKDSTTQSSSSQSGSS